VQSRTDDDDNDANMETELTRQEFNRNFQMSDNNAVTVDYCNAMNNVQTIVDILQINRCPKRSQTSSNSNDENNGN